MQLTCPACGYSKEVDAARIPDHGITAECPRCHHRFQALQKPSETAPPRQNVETATAIDAPPVAVRDKSSTIINATALFLLVDSTLSLLNRLSSPDLHHVSYLIGTVLAGGLFISAFGLFARKGWARIATIALLVAAITQELCLEGICVLLYQLFSGPVTQKHLLKFADFYKAPQIQVAGGVLYGFMIVLLITKGVKRLCSQCDVPKRLLDATAGTGVLLWNGAVEWLGSRHVHQKSCGQPPSQEPDISQIRKFIILLGISILFFFGILILGGLTFWFSSISVIFFGVFTPLSIPMMKMKLPGSLPITIPPLIYATISALALSFLSLRFLKKLVKPFVCFIIIGLITTGVIVYHSLKGGLVETHSFPNSDHPTIEIRDRGFRHPAYMAYIKRPLYRTEIGYLASPPSKTPPYSSREGYERCSSGNGDGVVDLREEKSDRGVLYDIHWSADGKRVAFCSEGWYMAAFDFDKGLHVEPERGQQKIQQFMGMPNGGR